MKHARFFKRFAVFAVVSAMTLTAAMPSFAAEPDPSVAVPQRFQVDLSQLNGGIANGGIVPNATDQSYYNFKSESQGDALRSQTNALLPEKLNLADYGLSTVVKDQSPWGSCWAFAVMSSIESNVLMQQKIIKDAEGPLEVPDGSELHLAWFYNQNILSGSQTGEGSSIVSDEIYGFDQGGNFAGAAALLTSWQGVADETDAPYQTAAGDLEKDGDWSVEESKRFDSVAHVQNVYYLPSPAVFENPQEYTGYSYDENATEVIKQALMANGVVAISYYADQSRPNEEGDGTYFNYNNWAQHCDTYLQPNHGVSIIGWDDTYPKENFPAGHQPEQDGAWIVKNSWGTNPGGSPWGFDGSGCFYLSYYDQTISTPASFAVDLMDADGNFTYQNNYQYDFLGQHSFISPTSFNSQERSKVANVFTAQGDETLEAVSTLTTDPGSTVDVEIYKLTKHAKTPTDGILVSEFSETLPVGGYYTLELEEGIPLREGERFSVVQTIHGASGYFSPIEVGNAEAYDGVGKDGQTGIAGAIKQTAVANEGESFVWDETNDWLDVTAIPTGGVLEMGNVMIKAFTNDTQMDPVEENTFTEVDNRSSLPDEAASLAEITGRIEAIEPTIVLDNLDADSKAYEALINAATEGSDPFALFDMSIPSATYMEGAMKVTLPVGEEYNGRTAAVAHYLSAGELDQNGRPVDADTVDWYTGLAVENGTVTISAYSLSAFSISLNQLEPEPEPEPTPDPDPTPQEPDDPQTPDPAPNPDPSSPNTGYESNLWMLCGMLFLSAGSVMTLFVVRKRMKKQREIG